MVSFWTFVFKKRDILLYGSAKGKSKVLSDYFRLALGTSHNSYSLIQCFENSR